jgi:hypothetical protein
VEKHIAAKALMAERAAGKSKTNGGKRIALHRHGRCAGGFLRRREKELSRF